MRDEWLDNTCVDPQTGHDTPAVHTWPAAMGGALQHINEAQKLSPFFMISL